MIKAMPDAVEELIPNTSKLGHVMATTGGADWQGVELDFGQTFKEFTYHHHGDDGTFKGVVFREQWDLPYLRKLHLSAAHENGIRPQTLAFDAALLNHLKDLRSPSEVVVTEATYHKKLE
ncbi:hypothetical protein BGX30_003816 [Mortierella sp. GBA39]|nr:hypothetical protein BGX30_003816 [Mortierella sp. GBA39]